MNPVVSVVIPVYNASRFLRETINSVLQQTLSDFELILVNDASTDDSLAVAEEFRKDSRVRVITLAENLGVANARNVGIATARGRYIALLDSDDYWEPEKLELQISLMEREKADIVYCSFDLVDEKDDRMGTPFLVPRSTSYNEMLTRCVFNCCTSVFRASLLKKHPFRTDQFHEDYVLWMELMALPVKAVGVPKILAHNRQRNGSKSHNKLYAAMKRWRIYRDTFGFGFGKSAYFFAQYAAKGVQKYYL